MAERINTRLESEAAEFFVLAQLLLRKIQCFKSYTNYPGYDLVAVSRDGQTSKRIQVKSRWQTNYNGFPIKNFECDFVVFVALNRGYMPPRKSSSGIYEPNYYIFPVETLLEIPRVGSWSKLLKRDLPLSDHQDQWNHIIKALEIDITPS